VGTKSRRLRAAVRRPEPLTEVRPGSPRSDLRGRQPVRITAEGRHLVCCGFRGQRVEIRSGSVSAVVLDDDRSLILVDRDGRMLLRAPGDWNSYALGVLCRRAAALGNLISGALLTLALPVLAWRTVRRLRDQRRAAREDLIEGIW
jgi:hypothetical protein